MDIKGQKQGEIQFSDLSNIALETQGPSLKVFVKKKVQRCGVWQIKPMTSLDQDPLSTKSNNSGFGGYSQMKIYKGCKNGTKLDILVWFGFGNTIHDFLVDW